MATNKKLIAFEDRHIEALEEYCKETGTSFTQAVRQLAMIGLDTWHDDKDENNTVPEGGMPTEVDRIYNDIENLTERVTKIEEDKRFWNADETSSKIGDMETKVSDLDKKLNTVVAIAKKLKGHLDNRGIHLQD